MCWGVGASTGMMLVGVAGAVVTWRRGEAPAIPVTLAFYAAMEGLQLAGYLVIDQCGSSANQSVTVLSMLHIAVQPLVLNAFIMAMVRADLSRGQRAVVYGLSALASALIVVQMLPVAELGQCQSGVAVCARRWCTVSGDWHLGWEVPYNGLFVPLERALHVTFGFPSYFLAIFVLPLFYGAWRFVVFLILVGPVLSNKLTSVPNEAPAIWCLFAIAILLVSLSPPVRRFFEVRKSAAGRTTRHG